MRATWLFAYAQRLAAQDRLEDALAMFERVADRHPRSAGAYLHWALTLSEAGRVDEAIDKLQQAMALKPSNAILPLFLGQILFDHGHYDEARPWCEKTLQMKSSQLRAAALLGLIDIACGKIDSGYERLQQPQTGVQTFASSLLVRQSPAVYQQISSTWQSRLLLVVETYLMQQEREARTLACQLLLRPDAQHRQRLTAIDRVFIYGGMGLTRLWYRLRYKAEREAWCRYAEAEKAYYLNQFQEAACLYAQFDHTFPARPQIEERLYEMAYRQADFSSALQHWHRYLSARRQPQKPDAFESFILGELQLQRGDYKAAARSLVTASDSPWRDYRVPYYQGLCHLKEGARREARRCFAAATDMINPDLATLRLEELYRVANALKHAPKTQAPMPASPHANHTETHANP